jgi:hypothetical protein
LLFQDPVRSGLNRVTGLTSSEPSVVIKPLVSVLVPASPETPSPEKVGAKRVRSESVFATSPAKVVKRNLNIEFQEISTPEIYSPPEVSTTQSSVRSVSEPVLLESPSTTPSKPYLA